MGLPVHPRGAQGCWDTGRQAGVLVPVPPAIRLSHEEAGCPPSTAIWSSWGRCAGTGQEQLCEKHAYFLLPRAGGGWPGSLGSWSGGLVTWLTVTGVTASPRRTEHNKLGAWSHCAHPGSGKGGRPGL